MTEKKRPERRDLKKNQAGAASTRKRLLDAAIDLFAKKGYDGVSVRDITRAVGIKESSLYNHYPSKEDLLEAVFDYFQKEMTQKAPTDEMIGRMLQSLDPVEFMKMNVTRFIEHWDDPDREKSWFVVSMEQYKNRKAAEIILNETERIVRYMEKIFQKMLALKMIKPCDPKLLAAGYAYALRAMHLEYELLKTFRLETRDIKKRMFELVDFYMASLKTGIPGEADEKREKVF